MAYLKCLRGTLKTIPTGSTATPTDDIQTLLNCADIWDKSYTTLSELLADTTTLQAVISSNNAIDYLVRSTTWASGMCANSTAMSYIGLNNYASNTLLADSTWCNAICNSTYFESVLNVKVPIMTSDNTPSGECFASSNNNLAYKVFDGIETGATAWYTSGNGVVGDYVGYDFGSNKKIYKAIVKSQYNTASDPRLKNYKYQGFNGTTWVDISAEITAPTLTTVWSQETLLNAGDYSKVRLYSTSALGDQLFIFALQFYGRADV